MREVSVAEAAAELGVSADTVKRRLQGGRLEGRKDEAGRWAVVLPDAVARAVETGWPEVERLRVDLDHARELIGELRARAAAQEAMLSAGMAERSELRQLLAVALQARALPADAGDSTATATQTAPQIAGRRAWWQVWVRS